MQTTVQTAVEGFGLLFVVFMPVIMLDWLEEKCSDFKLRVAISMRALRYIKIFWWVWGVSCYLLLLAYSSAVHYSTRWVLWLCVGVVSPSAGIVVLGMANAFRRDRSSSSAVPELKSKSPDVTAVYHLDWVALRAVPVVVVIDDEPQVATTVGEILCELLPGRIPGEQSEGKPRQAVPEAVWRDDWDRDGYNLQIKAPSGRCMLICCSNPTFKLYGNDKSYFDNYYAASLIQEILGVCRVAGDLYKCSFHYYHSEFVLEWDRANRVRRDYFVFRNDQLVCERFCVYRLADSIPKSSVWDRLGFTPLIDGSHKAPVLCRSWFMQKEYWGESEERNQVRDSNRWLRATVNYRYWLFYCETRAGRRIVATGERCFNFKPAERELAMRIFMLWCVVGAMVLLLMGHIVLKNF